MSALAYQMFHPITGIHLYDTYEVSPEMYACYWPSMLRGDPRVTLYRRDGGIGLIVATRKMETGKSVEGVIAEMVAEHAA